MSVTRNSNPFNSKSFSSSLLKEFQRNKTHRKQTHFNLHISQMMKYRTACSSSKNYQLHHQHLVILTAHATKPFYRIQPHLKASYSKRNRTFRNLELSYSHCQTLTVTSKRTTSPCTNRKYLSNQFSVR